MQTKQILYVLPQICPSFIPREMSVSRMQSSKKFVSINASFLNLFDSQRLL